MSQKPSPTAAGRPGGTALQLTLTATAGHAHVRYLRRNLLQAHRLLESPLAELSVALVGDRRMSRLHEEFLGISGPTDVLTFELEDDGRGRITAGEIITCVAVARRQAARRPHRSVAKELLLYALHGMLHLTGYDDTTEDGYRTMHRKEDEILRRLGVGSVFDIQPPDDGGNGARS